MLTTYSIARRNRATRALNIFARISAFVARAMERRRATVALSSLTDHQLRDIGISRAEIDHAVDHGRPGF
jgi:uncharacterized protein YjiS (DUF1127 family)